MRAYFPLALLVSALLLALFSFVSDDTFTRLSSIQKGVQQQRRQNDRLGDQVEALKREVSALQHDTRAVEKAARSELGMSRPDEITVVFEKRGDNKDNKGVQNPERRVPSSSKSPMGDQ